MTALSKPRRHRRGSTTVEMAFVGIPLVFVLISIFEISRGMWVYQTCAYAVKNGIRYAIVHGVNCVNTAENPNNCEAHISDIATVIQNSGIGLPAATTQLTFKSSDGTATSCFVSTCTGMTTTQWPPSTANTVGSLVRIDITTPFNSALAMFWPGSKGVNFAQISLGATSSDYIQF